MSVRLPTGLILALGLAAAVQPAAARVRKPPAPPAESAIQVVSADDEAEKANPGLYRRQAAAPAIAQQDQLRAALDDVFGQGRWRQTSGFRTRAQEDALRRAGAGTVKPGRISRHSVGGPQTPGAYDVVVAGMSPAQAAAKLKAAGQGWGRVAAEGAHGREGAHVHIELASDRDARGGS